MRYPFLSDSHTHSKYSEDGADSVMMLCKNALDQGFYAITVTDHCECNAYWEQHFHESVCQSWSETRRAAVSFQNKIHIFTGVELGQPMQDKNGANDILNACSFDFVLGSLHNVKDERDFYDFDYQHRDVRPVLNKYFEELLEMIRWGKFDSLAHLTYPWRYFEEYGLGIPIEDYQNQIDHVLKELIRQKKSLEVNTSGLRQKMGTTMPNEKILRRYQSFGGSMITVGSDAHRWADVGSGIEETLSMMRRIGFSHFTIYEKRAPVQVLISE